MHTTPNLFPSPSLLSLSMLSWVCTVWCPRKLLYSYFVFYFICYILILMFKCLNLKRSQCITMQDHYWYQPSAEGTTKHKLRIAWVDFQQERKKYVHSAMHQCHTLKRLMRCWMKYIIGLVECTYCLSTIMPAPPSGKFWVYIFQVHYFGGRA